MTSVFGMFLVLLFVNLLLLYLDLGFIGAIVNLSLFIAIMLRVLYILQKFYEKHFADQKTYSERLIEKRKNSN